MEEEEGDGGDRGVEEGAGEEGRHVVWSSFGREVGLLVVRGGWLVGWFFWLVCLAAGMDAGDVNTNE